MNHKKELTDLRSNWKRVERSVVQFSFLLRTSCKLRSKSLENDKELGKELFKKSEEIRGKQENFILGTTAPAIFLLMLGHCFYQAVYHMYKNRVGAAIERILFDLYSFI